jgi:hypothetical protein
MFRGKSVITQEYIYGYLCVARDNKGNEQTQILVPDNFIGYNKMYVVEKDTVEEELRMRDINGKRIYEGDKIAIEIGKEGVVPVQQRRTCVGQAVMHKGCECIKVKQTNGSIYIQLHMAKKIEIIESHGDEDKWKEVNV